VRILSGQEDDPDARSEEPDVTTFGVMLTHQSVDGVVELGAEDESFGTLVWFGLVGPVLKAIADGSVLLADELDASLHPALVRQVVRLFSESRDEYPSRPADLQLAIRRSGAVLRISSPDARSIAKLSLPPSVR
jgi:hypothetical protein